MDFIKNNKDYFHTFAKTALSMIALGLVFYVYITGLTALADLLFVGEIAKIVFFLAITLVIAAVPLSIVETKSRRRMAEFDEKHKEIMAEIEQNIQRVGDALHPVDQIMQEFGTPKKDKGQKAN